MQDKTIANRLKILRRQKNLSQKKAADDLSIHHSTLSKYENNQRSVPSEMLEKFASTYGVTVSALLEEENESSNQPKINYLVKRPYQGPINRFSVMLALSLFITIYLFIITGEILFGVFLFILGAIQVIYQAYHFFIHAPSMRRSVSFDVTKRVIYKQTDRTIIIKRQRFEGVLNSVLGFFSLFMAFGFFTTFYHDATDTLDQGVLLSILLINFFMVGYVMVHFILKRVYRTVIQDASLNTIFNTYKFVIMKFIAIFSFFTLLLYYAMALRDDARSMQLLEGVSVFLFIHFYLFFIYGTAQVAISYYKNMIIDTE